MCENEEKMMVMDKGQGIKKTEKTGMWIVLKSIRPIDSGVSRNKLKVPM